MKKELKILPKPRTRLAGTLVIAIGFILIVLNGLQLYDVIITLLTILFAHRYFFSFLEINNGIVKSFGFEKRLQLKSRIPIQGITRLDLGMTFKRSSVLRVSTQFEKNALVIDCLWFYIRDLKRFIDVLCILNPHIVWSKEDQENLDKEELFYG